MVKEAIVSKLSKIGDQKLKSAEGSTVEAAHPPSVGVTVNNVVLPTNVDS
jgi:hypothetical protein